MPGSNTIPIKSPSTVYINFTAEMPHILCVYGSNGVPEFFRHMDGRTPRIKFNLVVPDNYTCNVPFSIVKIVPVEIPKIPTLPPAERDRYQGEPTIVYDPEWTHSPASNFTEENLIVHGPVWKAQIPPVRLFIDLHECGHFFYVTEEYCDMYALVNFLRMGYNRSTAYYALSKVLRRSPENLNRIKQLFVTIQQATGAFSPE
jgi:hypothetical protein